MRKEAFQSLIRRVLNEEVEKRDAYKERVPEMTGNGIDQHGKDKQKTFMTNDANSRDRMSKEELLDDLSNVVDEKVRVVWDDHDDLMVTARDLRYIRISPNWEDNYKIEMFTRNEDRIWIANMDWKQVKDFVKTNMAEANLSKNPTAVEKAYDKSYRNREDQTPTNDKGMPQKDKPKILPLTNEPVKTTSNKDKTFTQKPKDDDDLPNKPMKTVEDFKKLGDYKVKDPVKLRKRKPDTKLVIKQS